LPHTQAENDKNCAEAEPALDGSTDHCNTAIKAIRLLLASHWEVAHEVWRLWHSIRGQGDQQKQEAREKTKRARPHFLGELRLPLWFPAIRR
jgi:hypothetical protein